MTEYIVAFVVSTAFVAMACSPSNHSRVLRLICGIGAVLPLSILAGARDFTVGTDIMVYGNRIFDAMVAVRDVNGVFEYAAQRATPGEYAYLLLNFVVGRFTSDAHAFYFVLSLISTSIVLIAVFLVRSLGSAVVMWLTFLLTAYVESYNLLRQSPALALGILGIALVLRSRPRLGFFVGISGLLFHNSAVVFIFLWAAASFTYQRRLQGRSGVRVVLIMTVVAILLTSPILDLLASVLDDTSYRAYLGDAARGGRAFGIDALYRLVPIVLGVILIRSALSADREREVAAPVQHTPERGLVTVGSARGLREIEVAGRGPLTKKELPVVSTATITAAVVLVTLLTVDLMLLSVREISYPFYRVLAYFGYMKILAYGVLVHLTVRYRMLASLIAVGFSAVYFALIVIDRNEAYYSSEMLRAWLSSLGWG